MSTLLSGKVAVVTGASRGLGRVMALALADAGARVVATARSSADELAVLAASRPQSIVPRLVDSADQAACQNLIASTAAEFGRVDILVNNAGMGMIHVEPDYRRKPVKFWNCPVDVWDRIVTTNVSGPFYLAAAVAPAMIAAGWGRIINVTTGHGTMVRPHYSPYGSSKASLEAATAIWAKDLASTGVTVNALLPGGATDTAFMPAETRGGKDRQLNLLSPEIMAEPVVWLASAASDGITGRRVTARKWSGGFDAALADAGWGPGGQPPGSDATT